MVPTEVQKRKHGNVTFQNISSVLVFKYQSNASHTSMSASVLEQIQCTNHVLGNSVGT